MKPLIPILLALDIFKRRKMTYKELSLELKKRGYPPEPFPAFQAASLYRAMHGDKR